MQELDFLPASYREQNAAHQARLCQLVVVLSFGTVIGLAACYQLALYRSAKQELVHVAAQHADAFAKTAQLAALRTEVEQARQSAELYTYLNYPWPRTQMLAEITRNLPPQVTIRELTIVEEAPPSTTAGRGTLAVDINQKPTEVIPAKADLDLLRSEQDRSRSQIQVSGTTSDAGALHLFVMALHGTPLFDTAKLHSLEAIPGGASGQPAATKPTESNFLIRLMVRPGYGQPDGPQAPPAVATQHVQQRSPERS